MSSSPSRHEVPVRDSGARGARLLFVVVSAAIACVTSAVAFPAAAAQARLAWQADPYGRVVDVTFDQPVALTAPWDRFRFSIDIVQPLTRESGAFLGDLDGDGVRDLLLASFNGSLVFVPGLTGQERLFGAGTLLRHTTTDAGEDPFAFGWGGYFVAGSFGDLDRDGTNEVVIGRDVYRNVGTTPAVLLQYVTSLPRCCGPFDPSISLGDLDGDGDLDGVVTHNYFSGGAYIYWNNSIPGAFALTCQLIAQPPAWWQPDNRLALGDLDGDGLLDLTGAAGIYFNSGTASAPFWDILTPSPWHVTGGPPWPATNDLGTNVFLVDADGDGDLDLYASGVEDTAWQALYYRNEGTAEDHQLVYVGPVAVRHSPVSTVHRGSDGPTLTIGGTEVTVADLDADGRADITVGGALPPAGAAILWQRALGPSVLTYPDLHTWPGLPHVDTRCGGDPSGTPDALCRPPSEILAWRDLDGDSAADALLGMNFLMQSGLSYYTSTGGWPFSLDNPPWPHSSPQAMVTSGLGSPVRAVGVAFVDIDLDGTVDMIGGQEDGTLLWYRNTAVSGMTLAEPVALADALSVPIDVGGFAIPTAMDLDGDGDLDLLVGTIEGPVHRVLCVTPGHANGYALAGLLAAGGQDPLDVGYSRLFATDHDGDGLVDVLASGGNANSVLLLRNTGTAQAPAFTVEPLLVSQTTAAYIEVLSPTTVRLYFALPLVIGQTTLTYFMVPSAGSPISGTISVGTNRPRRVLRRLPPS